MARPQVLHDGFLIPNAADVTNPRMAEPDRVDFNTLAHPLWGVIEGCAVTITGSTAATSGGTLIVNGALVTLNPGNVSLGVGTQDRFVLVVANASGTLTVVPGAQSVDPVFPDPPLDSTVLAAVFCPTGVPNLADYIIDKRKFVNKALLTKIDASAALVRNLNGTGDHYLVGGDGKTTWEGDTWVWRSAVATLSLHKHLSMEGTLTAQSGSFLGDVNILGNVNAANLCWSDVQPIGPTSPGAIWQSKIDGKVFVFRNSMWQELATSASAIPVGTVITSLEKPSVMSALGWIPLDGRRIYEDRNPALFTVQGLAYLIVNDTPRSMMLPDARKMVLMADFEHNPGMKVSPHPNNLVTLTTDNLARHTHNARAGGGGATTSPQITISQSGSHSHVVSGGFHDHAVTDPGHRHNGMDYPGTAAGAAVIALAYGGKNKIDALFNDRNHTFSVEAYEWTSPAVTGIVVGTGSSDHGHTVAANGTHSHTATMEGGASTHSHTITEDPAGNGVPFDITPEYLTVYTYVKG